MSAVLELVTWRDAHFEIDPDEWADDFLVETVGWVEQDSRWLIIAGEKTPNGDRCVTRVPLGMVVKRQKLEAVKGSAKPSGWGNEEMVS